MVMVASGSRNVLQIATQSASYNVLLQISFRIITFLMNGFILRYISREILGLINVRLTLLYTTILFIAREAFRKACLSKYSQNKTDWHQIINLLWLTVPLGVGISLIISFIWIYFLEQPPHELSSKYSTGVICYAVCAILELLAEPLWVISQCYLFVRLKVIIEGTAILLRCLTTVFIVYFFPSWGLMAFCTAQIVQSLTYSLLYYLYFSYYSVENAKANEDFPLKSFRDFFPQKASINTSLLSLTWSFFKQSFLKQLLTEGERYVMTIFNALTLAQQGIYDVINNIGSLAARFVFLPIEESYYLFFAQTLVRDKPAHKQEKSSLFLAANTLELVLKFVTLVGLTILVFGYSYSVLALDIYGGTILSSGEGPVQLRCHCLYVLIIAVNGITECFMFATMSQSAVEKYNKKMLLFSIIFLGSAWFLTHFGAVGFIFANCLNMLLRIIHSVIYILEYFKDTNLQPLLGLIPSKSVLLAYVFSFIITSISERYLCCFHGWLWRILHIIVGGGCLFIVAGIIYKSEQSLVQLVKKQLFSKFFSSKKTE